MIASHTSTVTLVFSSQKNGKGNTAEKAAPLMMTGLGPAIGAVTMPMFGAWRIESAHRGR
jgi:hypothetical protein